MGRGARAQRPEGGLPGTPRRPHRPRSVPTDGGTFPPPNPCTGNRPDDARPVAAVTPKPWPAATKVALRRVLREAGRPSPLRPSPAAAGLLDELG